MSGTAPNAASGSKFDSAKAFVSRHKGRLIALAIALGLAAAVVIAGPVSGDGHPNPSSTIATSAPCTYFAGPHGSDKSPGSRRRPFRSIQRLGAALRPGQTGCLRGGTYIENPDLVRSGLPGRRVTIESYRGERARLDGALWITSTARYVTVRNLTICGSSGAPGCGGKPFSSGENSAVQVSGGHAIFQNDEVSNPGGICFILGTTPSSSGRDGPGDHTTIADSWIHNCGVPGQSNVIEGIYVEYSTGSVIEHNQIYENAAMGVQLYPAAQYTAVEYNVLWGNGEGVLFGGSDDQASSHNVVAYNVIGHSISRWNIESSWPGPVGVGNVVYGNCVYADNPLGSGYYNAAGGIEPVLAGALGFVSSGELQWPSCGSLGLSLARR